MNLGETVTYRGLEGVFHGEACLYRLHVPSAFGGRAGFDLNISHVLPQGVLAALTLVGDGAGDEGARARARCGVELPLCSVGVTALSGAGSDPKLLEQKP